MKIFVYGTLKKGECNHRMISDSNFLGEHKQWMGFKMYDLGYFPALVCSRSNPHWIEGEIYSVSDTVMKLIDNLEGYPTLYQKTTIETEFGKAVVYYMNDRREDMTFIPSGRWH